MLSPFVLQRDAQHLEHGAEKYGARNWEKGQPVTRYWASAYRHLVLYMEGSREEDHLAAVRWNVGAIMHTEIMVERGKLPKELIDWPDFSDSSA